MQLDSSTAEILSGEFAHEAILVKAEQLANLEVYTNAMMSILVLIDVWLNL